MVTPQTIPELEGDLEVFFFCRENDNSFASPRDIEWLDPYNNEYIPGLLNSIGNARILAEGSRLRIAEINHNDKGFYRCLRRNNSKDFAEGFLQVHGILFAI